MLNDEMIQDILNGVMMPACVGEVRMDPHIGDSYGQQVHPTMYVGNAYYYCSDLHKMLAVDDKDNDDITYMFSWWKDRNRFSVSLIDSTEDIDTAEMSYISGSFSFSEEEHFQLSCTTGTQLSFGTEQLIQKVINDLVPIYDEALILWCKGKL